MEIKLAIDQDILMGFEEQVLKLKDVYIEEKTRMGLGLNEFIQYLVIGGGLVSISNCIFNYINSTKMQRKISVEFGDGKKIEIEGKSIDEIKKLLEMCTTIVIEKKKK
jgi:hypothetical protein